MDSFELNKILGAILGTTLLSAEIAAGDGEALLSAIPLAATVVAVVTGWAAAMIHLCACKDEPQGAAAASRPLTGSRLGETGSKEPDG